MDVKSAKFAILCLEMQLYQSYWSIIKECEIDALQIL